jgi:imidazolonepropionase-like amidohydrolase
MINLKKMADAGINIVAGTDAGNIGTQHAASYLRELQAMQKAGMSIWQILQSATSNPAKILKKEKLTGSIEVGKQQI